MSINFNEIEKKYSGKSEEEIIKILQQKPQYELTEDESMLLLITSYTKEKTERSELAFEQMSNYSDEELNLIILESNDYDKIWVAKEILQRRYKKL